MNKKTAQLNAIREFEKALWNLKDKGVMLGYHDKCIEQIFEYVDWETEEHIGEYESNVTPNPRIREYVCFDVSTLSTDYFGDLLKD